MKRTKLLVAFLGCLLYAQVSIPDTPAGQRLRGWLEVINKGEAAAMREFAQKYFPDPDERVERMQGVHRQTGGFDLQEIAESSATRITGKLKERKAGRTLLFEFEVEPQEPHRIAGIMLRPPKEAAPARMSERDALDALRKTVEERAAKDEFSGAVLVAKNGKPIFTDARGLADREHGVPNKLDTKFRIGSMNKMFTAVAMAQLAQAGKVKFTDPLGKHLTDYPNKDVASKVTIHHLLSHTGGTGDIFVPEYEEHRKEMLALQDYVKLLGKRGLRFEPGSRWEYSNYGFVLLGRLIEVVSGQTYYDYVREHIFKPSGMKSTDSYPESQQVPDRSVGYTHAGGGPLRPNNDTLPPRGTSAGGGYSTAGDLLRFANALLDHKLLNAEYTRIVTTGKVETARAGKYAYGFQSSVEGGIRLFGHGGGAPGMNGELQIYPDSGYVVAVLANLDPPAAVQVAEFIGDRLPLK